MRLSLLHHLIIIKRMRSVRAISPPMTFTRPVGVKESCDVCMPSMKVAESSEIIKNVPTSNMVMTDNIGTISQHLLQVSHSVALNRVSSVR